MNKRPQIDSAFVDKSGRITRVWRKFVENISDSIRVFEDQNSSRPASRNNEIEKKVEEIRKTSRPEHSIVELEKMIESNIRSIVSPLRGRINELEKEIEDIRRSIR